MAISPTSQTSARAIQTYQVCGLQSADNSSRQRSRPEQSLRNKSDTVQFSEEALDRLKLLKQQQEMEASKETQTTDEKDSELENSLGILNLSKNASEEEIRKAYLTAIQYYHPDKHAYLPPEFRQLAEAKCKQINEMYSTLLKLKASDKQDSSAGGATH